MEKLAFTLILLCSMATVFSDLSLKPKDVEKWFDDVATFEQKVTKLHFYFHDIFGITGFQVASANITSSNSLIPFGVTEVIDNPLTVRPEFNSTLVGRAQGLFSSTSMEKEMSLFLAMTLSFTKGKYSGSTLIIVARNPPLQQYRELPIIGGTGVFRLAHGIAVLKNYSYDIPNRNATVEYNVIVQHY